MITHTFAEVEAINHDRGECFLNCRLCLQRELATKHKQWQLTRVLRWPKVNQPEDKTNDL